MVTREKFVNWETGTPIALADAVGSLFDTTHAGLVPSPAAYNSTAVLTKTGWSNTGGFPYTLAAAYGVSTSETAANNTTYLNAAIAAAVAGTTSPIIVLPYGKINLNALTTITGDNITLQGQGNHAGGTELCFANATGDCITFSGGQNCRICDVYLTASVIRTANYALVMKGANFQNVICRVRIDYHYNGILLGPGTVYKIYEIQFRYMLGHNAFNMQGDDVNNKVNAVVIWLIDADNPYPVTNNPGLANIGSWAAGATYTAGAIRTNGGFVWQLITAGGGVTANAPAAVPSSFPPFYDQNTSAFVQGADGYKWAFVSVDDLTWVIQNSWAYSVTLLPCALIDGVYGIWMRDDLATGASYPTWLNVFNPQTDHNLQNGVRLSGGEGFYDEQGWHGSTMLGNGVAIIASFRGDIVLTACRVVGNAQHGILINKGPINTIVQNCQIYLNGQATATTYSGIAVAADTVAFTLCNNQVGFGPTGSGQQQYGILVNGGSSSAYTIMGNVLRGNVTAGLSDGGTGTNKVVTVAGSALNTS